MNIDIVQHFERFDGHGNGLIIKGRVRSGKTYLMAILANALLLAGFAVISNIRFTSDTYDRFDTLYYITSDREFFAAYLAIPENTRICLFWDDIQSQSGFKSTGVSSKGGDLLAKFLIFMGKLETNYVYCAHQKYIPSCILDGFEPLVIYKLERSHFWLTDNTTIYEHNYDIRRNCYLIPVPKDLKPLAIMSKAVARFKFELDLDELYDHLSRFDIGEDLRRGVSEYLGRDSQQDKYSHLKALTLTDIATAIYLKRGLISSGTKLKEIINDNTLQAAKKRIRKM